MNSTRCHMIRSLLLAAAAAGGCQTTFAQTDGPQYELLISNTDSTPVPRVLRFDPDTGNFRGALDVGPRLDQPKALAVSRQGSLFVAYRCPGCDRKHRGSALRYSMASGGLLSGPFVAGPGDVLGFEGAAVSPNGQRLVLTQPELRQIRYYDTNTGRLLGTFQLGLTPRGVTFGNDGLVYVLAHGAQTSSVHRYSLAKKAYLGPFVPAGRGGLDSDGGPAGLTFGPNGNLFVTSTGKDEVLEYQGSNGAFVGSFADASTGGCVDPAGIAFGPHDGNLYVACRGSDAVRRFSGTSGSSLGGFLHDQPIPLTGPTYLAFSRVDLPNLARLISPSPNAGVESLAAVFRWRRSGNPRVAKYRVVIARDPLFQNVVQVVETVNTQVLVRNVGRVRPGTLRDFFWRVIAVGASGQVLGRSPEVHLVNAGSDANTGVTIVTGIVRGITQSNANQGRLAGATVSVASRQHRTNRTDSTVETELNGVYIVVTLTTANNGSQIAYPIDLQVSGEGITAKSIQVPDPKQPVFVIRRDITVRTEPSRLVNAWRRARVGAGPHQLQRNFEVTGAAARRILIRGKGPSLNFAGAKLPDPRIALFRVGETTPLIANNNWRAAPNVAAIQATGLQPTHALEPVILRALPPGRYRVTLNDVSNRTGTANLEIYEVDELPQPRFLDLATRAHVGSGVGAMNAWIRVKGAVKRRVLIRGRGPSVTSNAPRLVDPRLGLYAGTRLVASNNDWASGPSAAEIRRLGRQPPSALEAAVLVNLDPGVYRILLHGGQSRAGIGLLEILDMGN